MKQTSLPWHKRTLRWAQTNITEIDSQSYDIDWWKEQWRKTRVQGVIFNAGGIVAYYPSDLPLTYHAEFLQGRDLFGELVQAARAEGLTVLARMDSNRVHEPVFLEHPEWIARDADGNPYKKGEWFVTSIDSPYYREYLQDVLREIATRYKPDGFTDNSYSGLSRDNIDYSVYSRRSFYDATGESLPVAVDWDDPVYRKWIKWSYQSRIDVWDLNNRTTRAAGGDECYWIGMIGGNALTSAPAFRDLKRICERTPIIMLDWQSRQHDGAFEQNAQAGQLLHGLLGWDKLIPDSMAMYEHAQVAFRKASKSAPEARLWALEGFAGGLQPWWHHIGAYHDDRRQYRTAEALWRWHAENEDVLVDRKPVASVGMVWSQDNVDFYGRDDGQNLVGLPELGITRAMTRGRIPFVPVHVDHVGRDQLQLLVLPNLAGLSDTQIQSLRKFVEKGGSLIATGETGCYDEWGKRRDQPGLDDLLGINRLDTYHGHHRPVKAGWDDWRHHTYLRLHPELRKNVDGPHNTAEPEVTGQRHPVLDSFQETDTLPFGGRLDCVQTIGEVTVPATFVPPFPIFPPEFSWMRHPRSDLPALVLREHSAGGRTAYVAADIDRCFGRDNLPDHAVLMQNLVRWAAGDTLALKVTGVGYLDCHLYTQDDRLILHMVNLTATGLKPIFEHIPVGPFAVSVRTSASDPKVVLRVAGESISAETSDGWVSFSVPRIVDHELVVIE